MTDLHDEITGHERDETTEIDTTDGSAGRRRRKFLTGAGIAGAAAIVGSKSASAADGATYTGSVTTYQNNESNGGTPGTAGNEAIVGEVLPADNGSHAIRGVTNGTGHSVAGDTPASAPNTVAATWGRHAGQGAGVGGVNVATTSPLAGPARAVEGVVTSPTNGSHAVYGETRGGGHSIAGDTPAEATGPDGTGSNTVAATWGRHAGLGAGIGGVNTTTEAVPIAGSARGVEGVVAEGTNGSHAVFGLTNGGGHSVAGDTPADAKGANGEGTNTVAATWGRHQGVGAGIGGISVGGYGGEFQGGAGKAQVRLIQVDNDAEGIAEADKVVGPPTDDDHQLGELFADGRGKLYYNNATGNNFVQLTQQVLFENPQRAWDSRAGEAPANGDKGKIASDGTVSIDLTEFTDVPAGASAALINISVADTDGIGYMTAFNGDTADDDRPLAASVTWSGPDNRATNSLTVRPSDAGAIKVYLGGSGAHVIVDVSGYIV